MAPIDMIDDCELYDTLDDAVFRYGPDLQLQVAIEEMAELTKEICKYKRGNNNRAQIAEEMADVYIMLCQMRIIFKNENDIETQIRQKILRLQERMEEESCTRI